MLELSQNLRERSKKVLIRDFHGCFRVETGVTLYDAALGTLSTQTIPDGGDPRAPMTEDAATSID